MSEELMDAVAGAQPSRAVSDAERLACAALTTMGEPGDLVLARFVGEHGAEATVKAIESGQFPGRALGDYQTRLATSSPARDLDQAARIGARLVCPGEDEWTEALDVLASAGAIERRGGVPLALWVRGQADLRLVTARSCAVVGARAASEYGQYMAGELGAGLADRGITVVSGAAFGIDAAAHRGALAGGGLTVAVLASGVDVAYPRAHQQLLRWIAEEGLIVSEVPPGSTPRRPRFLIRNRLIAALTQGTLVVEAALRSGALNTAAWAERCHREVMGVPGPVTSMTSAGVHRLLRDGIATLVTDADEVVEQISRIGENLAPAKLGERRPRDELDARARQVLEAVPVIRAGGVAGISSAAGIPPDEVLGTLGELLLVGYVERQGNGWRLSARERANRRHPSTAGRDSL
ncbi:DNA-processing protein DprA [Actinopolymorpha sp. B11F2]|uniref:DNA-processing protein DprA n=1 Tax=Actinopolymorpha sp. B11F2 TaxID=3160862 RepID=UPI0032E42B1A